MVNKTTLIQIKEWYITLYHKKLKSYLMKTILFIFSIVLALNSCKKEEPKTLVIDCSIGITVKDNEGKDLLDPSNSGAYLEQNIKVLELINGIKQEVNKANYTYPRDFRINELNGEFWMTLFLNASPTEDYPITYVQWNENDIDTFKCEIYRKGGLTTVKNLWLNDSLAWNWESYSEGPRTLNIIKQ